MTRASGSGSGNGRGDRTGQHYLQLRQDVLDSVFPADALLQETVLTARYGVSRTPIREALARLEQDGLLDRAPRGYRVRSGTPEDVLDIYEARIALEALAAAGAAQRCSGLELARLESLHTAALDSADQAQVRRLNTQWHEELWAASHNTTVRGILVRLTAQLRIYDQARVEDRADLDHTRTEHDEVMAALRERDAAAAAAAISAHLERSRDLRLHAFAAAAARSASAAVAI